jgi:hypothetical protein
MKKLSLCTASVWMLLSVNAWATDLTHNFGRLASSKTSISGGEISLLVTPFNATLKSMLPESIIIQTWDGEKENWVTIRKRDFTYENGSWVKELIHQSFTNEEFVPFMKEIRTFNASGVQQENHILIYKDNEWVNHSRSLKHTNNKNHILLEASLNWNNTTLTWDTIRASRIHYTYTPGGDFDEIWYSQREDADWEPTYMETHLYNEQGHIIQWIEKMWSHNKKDYVNIGRKDYFYNENNEWSQVISYSLNQHSNQWQPSTKSDIQPWYDFEKRMSSGSTISFAVFDGDEVFWIPWKRYTYAYHVSTGKEILSISENYDVDALVWIPLFREATEMDQYSNPVLYSVENYINSQWGLMDGYRYTYDWDTDETRVTTQRYQKNAAAWTNDLREIYIWKSDVVSVPEIPETYNSPVVAYPNPADDKVSLSFHRDAGEVTIYIQCCRTTDVLSELAVCKS